MEGEGGAYKTKRFFGSGEKRRDGKLYRKTAGIRKQANERQEKLR